MDGAVAIVRGTAAIITALAVADKIAGPATRNERRVAQPDAAVSFGYVTPV
jgi:aromatic ring hydroxylase